MKQLRIQFFHVRDLSNPSMGKEAMITFEMDCVPLK